MRVVAVRALPGLGDWLCAVPALAVLRRALPDAEVVLVALERCRALTERYDGLVDRVVGFPGFPTVPEEPVSPDRLVTMMEEHHGAYDLCLQLHGTGQKINEFCLLLGARRTVLGTTVVEKRSAFPDLVLCPVSDGEHETDRLVRLVGEVTGRRALAPTPWFPIRDHETGAAADLLEKAGVDGRYVVLHPGASRSERRWPARCFAEVGSALAADGAQVVVTGGPDEEALARSVADAIGGRAVSLAGRSTLGSLAVVLEGSDAVVSNDTGVAHLAAAVEAPVAVVFVTSDPGRWAPRGTGHIQCVAPGGREDPPSVPRVLCAVRRLAVTPGRRRGPAAAWMDAATAPSSAGDADEECPTTLDAGG